MQEISKKYTQTTNVFIKCMQHHTRRNTWSHLAHERLHQVPDGPETLNKRFPYPTQHVGIECAGSVMQSSKHSKPSPIM
jgi:hypothetical protein